MDGVKCSWCDKLTHRQKMLVVLLISILLVVGVFSMGFSLGEKAGGFNHYGRFGMMGKMMERGGCPMMNNFGGRQFNNERGNNFGNRNNNQMRPQGQINAGENNTAPINNQTNFQPKQDGQQNNNVQPQNIQPTAVPATNLPIQQ